MASAYMVFATGHCPLALPVGAIDRVQEIQQAMAIPGAATAIRGLAVVAGRSQLVTRVDSLLSTGVPARSSLHDTAPIWVALNGSGDGLILEIEGPFAFTAGGSATPRPAATAAICHRGEQLGTTATGIISVPRLLLAVRRSSGPLAQPQTVVLAS